MTTGNDHSQLDSTLRDLRDDIVESRNLTIKTDNLVKNLSADIRQIGKRQETFEKKFVFNSVMAYVLFSVLIFAGLYLAFQAQVSRERDAVEAAHIRIGELQTRVGELESELQRRREAEEEAYTVFRLAEEKKYDEVLARFPTIRGKIVNRAEKELLAAEVDRINSQLAFDAFEYGIKSFKTHDYEKARDAFNKSLRHVEKSHYSPQLEWMLGMSLFKLKNDAEAVEHLKKSLDYKFDRGTTNEIVYHLASALDRVGRYPEARHAYEVYAQKFAYDKRAPGALKRTLEFNREGIRAEGELQKLAGLRDAD